MTLTLELNLTSYKNPFKAKYLQTKELRSSARF